MLHSILTIITKDFFFFVWGMYSVNHADKEDYLFWKLVRKKNSHSYSQMDWRSQFQKTRPDTPVELAKNKQYLRDISFFGLKFVFWVL